MTTITPTTMSNRELIEALSRAARDERSATVELLVLLGELDERRLFLGEGCSSTFTYCTEVPHLSEHAAYHRIEVARAARRFPVILSMVADGAPTLTTVALLQSRLTPENHEHLLVAARHKSKREVEHQIACLAPKADAKTLIRRMTPRESIAVPASASSTNAPLLPARTNTTHPTTATKSGPPPTMAPLASDRYLLRVTISAAAHANLRRAQDLMCHTIPNGDAAAVIEHALALLVSRLERVKIAKAARPRTPASMAQGTPPSSEVAPSTRHIGAAIRRAVWVRDRGRCAFVGTHGRCTETGCLEYHHQLPFAHGGPASVENISLRCRAHNRFESEAIFGAWVNKSAELGPDRGG